MVDNKQIAHDLAAMYAVGTVLNGSKNLQGIVHIYQDAYDKILEQFPPKEPPKFTGIPYIPTRPSEWKK